MGAALHQRHHPHLRKRAATLTPVGAGRPNSLSLAGVSAASQHDPSTAISRRPRQNAPGMDGLASGRAVAANSTRNGSAPSRSRAR
jgi:hypothetical protein